MFKLWPDRDLRVKKIRIGSMPAMIVMPKHPAKNAPGVVWIHGGGYILGMKEMVFMSRAIDLVRKYGAVVISPGYRLAWQRPYPAAVNDCYDALEYLNDHAEELGVDRNRIIVGGESAGGGLTAAVCMMARDKGEIKVVAQLPLYPMLSNIDTESSRDNHGKVWNTRRNHIGWKLYLRKDAKSKVPAYASPSWQQDYRDLPPAYTFVGDGEPFYTETLQYIENLKNAGVEAEVDVYHTDMHAFDMLKPQDELSRQAISRFEKMFERYVFGEKVMRKILVVVDMQNDFIDGALGTPEAEAIVENVKDRIRAYDKQDIFVTMDTHGADYMDTQEGRNLPVEHCIRGTKGWEIRSDIAELLEGAAVYEKPTFGSLRLAEDIAKIASYQDIEIEIIGLCTDICVVSNALLLKANMPEVPISVDPSCCAGVTPETHEAALRTMQMCQINTEL